MSQPYSEGAELKVFSGSREASGRALTLRSKATPRKPQLQPPNLAGPAVSTPCCLHTGLGAGAVPSLALRQPSLNPSPGLSPGECGQAAKLALLTSRAVMGHTWPAYTGPRTLLSRYHLDVGGWASLDSDYEDKPVPESYMTTSTLTPL